MFKDSNIGISLFVTVFFRSGIKEGEEEGVECVKVRFVVLSWLGICFGGHIEGII